MRKITHIVVHCTATPEGRQVRAKDIDVWHKKRGFARIGYHYVVRLDGTVELGRPLSKMGAHVLGHNRYTIGVVYVGGLSADFAPKDTRTPQQKKALKALLIELKTRFPEAEICGHRDFSKDLNHNGIIEPFEWMKVCPCFDAKNEYKDL